MKTTTTKKLSKREANRLYLAKEAGDAARRVGSAAGPLSVFRAAWTESVISDEESNEAAALQAQAEELAAKLRDLHHRLGGTWSFEE